MDHDDPAAAALARILVCEDDPHLLGVILHVLRECGYDARGTCEPLHALELAGSMERVDLLVTDVVMPEVLGTSLAKQVARVRPGVPVLFISGYTEDPEAMMLREVRSSSFLPKPFEATELLEAVRARLGAR